MGNGSSMSGLRNRERFGTGRRKLPAAPTVTLEGRAAKQFYIDDAIKLDQCDGRAYCQHWTQMPLRFHNILKEERRKTMTDLPENRRQAPMTLHRDVPVATPI